LLPIKIYNFIKILNAFKTTALFFTMFLFFGNSLTFAQTRKNAISLDSNVISIKTDSNLKLQNIDTLNYTISKDALKTKVTYKATDSIVYDAELKIFMLYTKANIKYDDIELKSDKINYNIDSNTLNAHPYEVVGKDTNDKPTFKQGEQLFTFTELNYNFKSQRALVAEAHTQYGEGYILSDQVKRNNDKSIFGLNNIYTTCSLDTPHFGIYAKKIKVIPDVVGISGPARLVIENIPTPIILPFALYPLTKGQHAGFIFPQYGFEQARGFRLSQGGYYFPINEYMDFKLIGDIYSYGSWRIGGITTYNKKYSYTGNFNLDFSSNVSQNSALEKSLASRTFAIGWTHNVDPKLLQGASFSASVNIASSNNNLFNFNQNVNIILQNQLRSNIRYSKQWKGKPYNFTVTLGHVQNNNTHQFDLTLPEANFSASGITPFAKKNIIGLPKWYEKISVNYSTNFKNLLSFYDTAFNINKLNARNLSNGMVHNINSGYSTKFFKYINFNIGARFNEYWYTNRNFKYYNNQINRLDTINNYGFFAARDFGTTAGFSTNVYGTKLFRHGNIKGIRHNMSPSVTFSYTPSFGNAPFNYWYNTFVDTFYKNTRKSYFENGIYGGPSDAKSGAINFGLNNSLQLKMVNKNDTTNPFKKINIFDNFNFNTTYDIARDSLKWSDISYNFSTSLFNNKLSIRGGGVNSLYAQDTNYRGEAVTVNKFEYNKSKSLTRFENFSLNLGTSFRSAGKDAKSKASAEELRSLGTDANNYNDFNIPWDITLNANFDIRKVYNSRSKKDTINVRADFNFSGNVNLTPHWKINATSGYDFISKNMSITSIGMSRDLHCWEMSFTIVPFGYGKSYNFTLAPKSGMLKDLRVTRNKSFYDYR
jgi:lipopolysaccharide assembly outer membrane protein LptD (OstA)